MAYDKTVKESASKKITIEQKLHITDPVAKKLFYMNLFHKEPDAKYSGKLVNTDILTSLGYELSEGGQS